ncbi:hypothetical protein M973_05945 [Francisella orientalis LADL 07-285A]|nr:hypothetical protein M973_05945 [Francisella orientalis LADL 07-285A]
MQQIAIEKANKTFFNFIILKLCINTVTYIIVLKFVFLEVSFI